jgi:hypothetical protein
VSSGNQITWQGQCGAGSACLCPLHNSMTNRDTNSRTTCQGSVGRVGHNAWFGRNQMPQLILPYELACPSADTSGVAITFTLQLFWREHRPTEAVHRSKPELREETFAKCLQEDGLCVGRDRLPKCWDQIRARLIQIRKPQDHPSGVLLSADGPFLIPRGVIPKQREEVICCPRWPSQRLGRLLSEPTEHPVRLHVAKPGFIVRSFAQ